MSAVSSDDAQPTTTSGRPLREHRAPIRRDAEISYEQLALEAEERRTRRREQQESQVVQVEATVDNNMDAVESGELKPCEALFEC